MRRTAFTLSALVFVAAELAAQKLVFVTQEAGFGNLSEWKEAEDGATGVEAGNSICRKLADLAGLPNADDFRAWLSDSTTDAYCNVAGFTGQWAGDCGQLSLPDAGPWLLTNGKPFARSLSELTGSNAVLWVPHVDQHGATLFPVTDTVMTGTTWQGTRAPDDCGEWGSSSELENGLAGRMHEGAGGWTETVPTRCDSLVHLYCFEAGSGPALAPFDEPGAYAFVTSSAGGGVLGDWDGAGGESGIAAGDAICRQAAVDGGLPSPASFVAWLSDGETDAKDRLTIDGPWRRPDGPQVAADLTQLLTSLHQSAIEVDELGAHRMVFAFTGTFASGTKSPDHCAGWTSSAGAGGAGRATSAFLWTDGYAGDCDVPNHHLYCLSNVVTILADGFERGDSSAWSATVD